MIGCGASVRNALANSGRFTLGQAGCCHLRAEKAANIALASDRKLIVIADVIFFLAEAVISLPFSHQFFGEGFVD